MSCNYNVDGICTDNSKHKGEMCFGQCIEADEPVEHSCADCKWCHWCEDSSGRDIYFCLFDKSHCYLEETGICGFCMLEGYAEELYKRSVEE